jgi:glycine oxidase
LKRLEGEEEMRKSILIIGGGVIGCSIAYHLAKHDIQSVIVERNQIGAHASSAAAGMLAAQAEMDTPGPFADLCLTSRAMFPRLQQELLELTDIDIELNRSGLLRVALDEGEAKHLQCRQAWQVQLGQPAEWLNAPEVYRWEPRLSSDVIGALYLPADVQISAPRLTQAFACAVRRLGVEIYEECEVIQLRREGERITQVMTQQGMWSVDRVILATGAWSRELAEQVGIHLPIYPLKGESLAIQSEQPLIQKTIFTEQVYLVPKANGEMIIGATEKPDEVGCDVSVEAIQYLLFHAIQLVPDVASAKIARFWAGIRPASGDGKPIIGRSKNCSNLFIASGHGRNGILLSPITGEQIARAIIEDKPAIIEPFQPDRFLPLAIEEVSSCKFG